MLRVPINLKMVWIYNSSPSLCLKCMFTSKTCSFLGIKNLKEWYIGSVSFRERVRVKIKKSFFVKCCFDFFFFFCFFLIFQLFEWKTLKKHISSSIWSAQHPNTGQNTHHLSTKVVSHMSSKGNYVKLGKPRNWKKIWIYARKGCFTLG